MRTMWVITGVWLYAFINAFLTGMISPQLPFSLASSGWVSGMLIFNAACWAVTVGLMPALVIGWPIVLSTRALRPRRFPELPLFQLPRLPGWYKLDEKTGHYIKVSPPC